MGSRLTAAILLSALFVLPACAQTNGTPTTVLQANTQLVVVDVTVTDKNGQPVHGLKASDFQLAEANKPQVIQHFEEHRPSTAPQTAPAPLKLPPGTYTNYTPIKPNETLNVVLLDTLNTPTKDQIFVRQQLQKYVQAAPPDARIAIFGLSTHLILLQSFTADPVILKDAVDHKLIPRASDVLDDPSGTNPNAESLSDQMSDHADQESGVMAATLNEIAANLADFEAQSTAFQTGLRAQYTLDAFNTLAHYLAAFPGRKNVIWFSGSFPITLFPDPDAKGSPFAGVESKSDEFQQTSAILGRAQVAVYPIDARGLMTDNAFDATATGTSTRSFTRQVARFNNTQADEHSTLTELATNTGGQAFFNTNGLADAVAKSVNAGANYYTLTYVPTDHREDGAFRTIHVTLAPSAAHSATLSYRRGYYADKPAPAPPAAAHSTLTPQQEAERHTVIAYANAAMARGGPSFDDILFKVRVLPTSRDTSLEILPEDQPSPAIKFLGPFHNLAIDFVTLPSEITAALQPDGSRTGRVEFIAFLYDTQGKLLNTTGKTFALHIAPADYPHFLQSPINIRMQLSIPTRTDTYLRLGIHDIPSNRFGVLEIPTSGLAQLPLAPTPTPSAAPSRH